MLRHRLAWVKHIAMASFAAVLLLGAVEIGLRVHHSYRVQTAQSSLELQSLSSPSWRAHHTLKPLKSTVRRNPDTKVPVTIRTNSLGLRGEGVRIPKPPDLFRVLYLGDDAVFAPEINEEDCFAHRIENELIDLTGRKMEVVNAGLPNSCPLLSYLHFKHFLAALQPDLVLLNVDMSDVADDHYYRRHTQIGPEGVPILCSNPALQRPFCEGADSNSTEKRFLFVDAIKRQFGLLPADENRASDCHDLETTAGCYAWTREKRADWRVYIDQTLSPIPHLQELTHQLSCPLVVTMTPVPWQISQEAMPDARARKRWGIGQDGVYDAGLAMGPIRRFLNSRSIPFCDVTSRFQAERQPETLFLESVPRFSKRGHRLFADVVSEYLARTVISHRRTAAGALQPLAGE